MATGVQSVVRAMRVLEAVTQAPAGVGVRELARSLGLKAPTVHGLIKTLAAEGYLCQDEQTGRYLPGLKFFVLAGACMRSRSLPAVAMPHMERFSADTGETVLLAMMQGGKVVWAAQALGTQRLVANLEDYPPVQPYETASGRVLLAYASGEALAAFVRDHPIAKSTGDQIRSRADLDRELAAVRERGYAIIRHRGADTLSAVAAPVRNHLGRVVAAVGLSMPSTRFCQPHLTRVLSGIQRAAASISLELGWEQQGSAAAGDAAP